MAFLRKLSSSSPMLHPDPMFRSAHKKVYCSGNSFIPPTMEWYHILTWSGIKNLIGYGFKKSGSKIEVEKMAVQNMAVEKKDVANMHVENKVYGIIAIVNSKLGKD